MVRDNVECPSLSPDGTRLVFKKRTDPESPREWRLAVLDLASMQESPVPGFPRFTDQYGCARAGSSASNAYTELFMVVTNRTL